MSGYNVKVTRDVAGDIVTADILSYIDGLQAQPSLEGEEILLITGKFLENPKTAVVGSQVAVVNDDDQDTNDGLWNSMEFNIRNFAETKMGVDDDSNLVASVRDDIKLLNTSIFLGRFTSPNEYKNDGLLAHITTTSFTLGDPLDTGNKVINFYNEVLRELHDSVIGERDTFLDNRL